METIFVLDASGFIFRAYFALPEMKNSSGQSTQAIFGFIRSINKLIKEFSPSHMVAVFDGPDNKESRRKIYADYKSNRQQRVDLYQQIPLVKEYCALLGLACEEVPGVEADDVIASITKCAVSKGYRVCICTMDKDLLQLVGPHVVVINPWKDSQEITEEDVKATYGVSPENIPDYLALVGDTSDNIPGVVGCGPKTAKTLLGKYTSVEEILRNFDQLTPSVQRMFSEQKEVLLLSKDLALLNHGIDIGSSIEDYVFPLHETSREEINTFYMHHGFKTLVQYSEEKKVHVHVQTICDSQSLAAVLPSLYGKSVAFSVGYLGSFLPSLTLLGIALACDGAVYYIDIDQSVDDLITPLKSFFGRKDTEFYGYNIKRDSHALKNAGIEVHAIALDLALAEHLVHGGAKNSFQSLLVHQGLTDIACKFGKEWGQLSLPIAKPPQHPAQYFGEFVSCLPGIKQSLLDELERKGLLDLFLNIEMPLEKVLFIMERNGVPIDVEVLHNLEEVLSEELVILTDEIYIAAGGCFNIKSPKQLSDVLYNKLGLKPLDKALSTKAEVLEGLLGEHEIVDKILSFRAVEKLLSTYVKALPRQIDPHTRRIHPTFNQMGTATGRLACQDPNLQNIPIRSHRGKLLRRAFCTDKENVYFLSADYSQIELRFLAHLSQDESLRLAFESQEDIHTFTAAQVFHVPLEDVTEQQRMQAKTVNFGIIYGQQAYGLSKTLKISLTEAQQLIDAYFERYPKVAQFIHETVSSASENLKVTTLLGRERVINNWTEFSASRASSGRLAVNTRIQGSAAELIKLAMLQLSDALKKRQLKSRMLLQIHDELIFEVPEEEKEEMLTLVRDIMESAMILSVPLVVNILIGKNWAEC